jgi:hypothetical protein
LERGVADDERRLVRAQHRHEIRPVAVEVRRHVVAFGKQDAQHRHRRARAPVYSDILQLFERHAAVELHGTHGPVGSDTDSRHEGLADAAQVLDDRDQPDIDFTQAQLLGQASGSVERENVVRCRRQQTVHQRSSIEKRHGADSNP